MVGKRLLQSQIVKGKLHRTCDGILLKISKLGQSPKVFQEILKQWSLIKKMETGDIKLVVEGSQVKPVGSCIRKYRNSEVPKVLLRRLPLHKDKLWKFV